MISQRPYASCYLDVAANRPRLFNTLLDVLLNMLSLDLVYVRLKNPAGGAPLEMVRVAEPREPMPRRTRSAKYSALVGS